jgi:hypothetical protein
MTKKISVSLPLNEYFLDEIYELCEKIKKSFSINLKKNLLCRYHINLFSGKLYNFDNLINIIKNIKLDSSKTNLILFGFGIFLKENPNIHLRFSSESFLLEVRKFLFTHREIWKDIDLTTLENMWLPKSTIFNSNLSIQDDFFLEVLKFLNSWKFSCKNIYFQEICLIEYEEDIEKEIKSFNLLK